MTQRKPKLAVEPTIQTNDNAPKAPPARKHRFELHPASGLELDTSSNYLIKGLMPAADLLVLYGPPGTGKSFLALDAALHVAAGREWAGCRVHEQKAENRRGVVYVASEGARGFRRRVIAAMAHRGFAADIPFALVEEAPDLSSASDLAILIADIDSQSKALGFTPILIVLDTLARSIANLNESDSQGMNTFIGNAKALHKHFNALIMPVHHTGKDVERGMRGSSALQGAADAIWCLKRENDETRFELEKMKDGADGVAKAFTLLKYGLGADDDGDEMSTLVVDKFGEPAPAEKKSAAKARAPGTADEDLPLVLEIFAAEGKTGTARAKGLGDEVPAIMRQKLMKSLATRLRAEHPELGKRCEATRAGRCLKTLEANDVLRIHGKWSSLAAVGSVTEDKT